jgi:cytochrome c-type biogenesis protein CcmF
MLWKQFRLPILGALLVVGLVGGLIPASRATSSFLHDAIKIPASLICFGISGFVLVTIAQEFYIGTRARQKGTGQDFLTAMIGLVGRNKRRYGGYLVHVGVVLMFIGFAGQTYQQENDVTLDRNQTTKLGRYTVTYQGHRESSDPQKEVTEVFLSIAEDGKPVGTLRPAKWAYRGHDEEPPRTIVTIRESLREDLYVILNGIDAESGLASIKVIINPLVNWVWFGFVLLIIGTVIAFLPERAYEAMSGGAGRTAATAVVVLCLLSATPAAAFTLAAAGDSGTHSSSVGSAFPTPPRNELERDLRKSLVCMCGCGRQTLSECTCGFAAKERAFIADLIDAGKSRDEIVKAFISRYPGESALVVPVDAGFNRLAWIVPVLALLSAGGALVVAARRWTRNPAIAASGAVKSAPPGDAGSKKPGADGAASPDNQKYIDRLDDDLDDLT